MLTRKFSQFKHAAIFCTFSPNLTQVCRVIQILKK